MNTYNRAEFLNRTRRQAEILRTVVGWLGIISTLLYIASWAAK